MGEDQQEPGRKAREGALNATGRKNKASPGMTHDSPFLAASKSGNSIRNHQRHARMEELGFQFKNKAARNDALPEDQVLLENTASAEGGMELNDASYATAPRSKVAIRLAPKPAGRQKQSKLTAGVLSQQRRLSRIISGNKRKQKGPLPLQPHEGSHDSAGKLPDIGRAYFPGQ